MSNCVVGEVHTACVR